MAPAYDAIVLGLGAMGSATAFHLAARKQRVLGIEQYTPAHDRGSSHGGSRIIRQAYHEHPAYVPLVQRAYELWEQLERASGEHLLTVTGGLMIGPPGSPVVAGALASAREHQLPYEVLDAAALRRRYPAFLPRPQDTAVFENRAGYLRPEAAVRAHLAQAAGHGAELHFEEMVSEWRVIGDEQVEVLSSRGSYRAKRLVLTPGPWASDALAGLMLPLSLRRHVMCWFDPGAGALPLFAPERLPVYIWDVDGRHVFYGFPAAPEGVKAAMHSGGDLCTIETCDRAIHERDIAELRVHLARFLPALDAPLRHAAPCLYTMTPDEHFILGLHPRHPQVALAAGFSGHGFKFSSVVGEILADLAIGGATRAPITLFSPLRFARDGSVAESSAPAPNRR